MLICSITSRDLSIEVRVNSVVFAWRTLYRVLDWELVVGLAGWVLRLLAMICRRPIAEGFLALIERRLVVSGLGRGGSDGDLLRHWVLRGEQYK